MSSSTPVPSHSDPTPTGPQPTVVIQMSELDSAIAERMKSQPASLAAVEDRAANRDQWAAARHRLSLPSFFEKFSYEGPDHPGPYVFRWIKKDKRSIDRHLDVLGWTLVNRVYFPDAPRYLFTANGGIEAGDAILGFIPAKRALALREAPTLKSRERMRAQMTMVPPSGPGQPSGVLMTGNPDHPAYYKPDLGATEEEPAPGTGVVVERGTDFS